MLRFVRCIPRNRIPLQSCLSSRDQNEDRQLVAMQEVGVPEKNIYVDKKSGKDFDRPQYKKLLRKIKKRSALHQEH